MSEGKIRDPQTREEWQEAVDFAHFWNAVHSARVYGLVEGGPEIDVDRCDEILKEGKRLGIVPAPDAIEKCLRAMYP